MTRRDLLSLACMGLAAACLRNAGYEVVYREFDGPHTVPEDVAREALEWFTG